MKYICPNCNEEENLHINYDYNNSLKIENILCNECGTFFEINDTVPNTGIGTDLQNQFNVDSISTSISRIMEN